MAARLDAKTLRCVQGATARDHGSVFKRTAYHRVGGLWAVGAVDDLWLVASASGLGVVDAVSGKRVARDDGELPAGYPEATPGIGPLAGAVISMAGIHGAVLPQTSPDGWQLAFDERAGLWLAPPGCALDGPEIEVLRVRLDPPRVLGFSPSGRTWVIGDGATLATYAR